MTIENIVKRQFAFQNNMKSNQDIMFLALIEEFGEFVASTGYADWKKVSRDERNMDIELIDMAIFAINLLYYENLVYEPRFVIVDTKNETNFIRDMAISIGKSDWSDLLTSIFEYKPELLEILTAKQALNQLRQDYGYKEGDYIKDWNGHEDNEFLESMYGLSYDRIYDAMEDIYVNKIISSRLVDV